jgi:hypothetical protein
VRHAAGFISARLHRSLDGTKVTMYAQWRSVEGGVAHGAAEIAMRRLGSGTAACGVERQLRYEPNVHEARARVQCAKSSIVRTGSSSTARAKNSFSNVL